MNRINRILSEKNLTFQVRKWMPILAGNLLMAVAVNGFIVPAGFIAGGSTGLAIVLERLVYIPFNMAVNLISISCFVIGFLVLGRKFAARTLVSAVVYPVCVQLTSFLKNLDLTSDPLVQAIAAGLLMGAGLGMILQADASSGGLDIPPIILEKKFHIPVTATMWAMDAVLLTAQIREASMVQVLMGFVFMAVTYLTMNRILSSGKQAVEMVVYTGNPERILDNVLHIQNKGASLIAVESGYSRKTGYAVHSVFRRKDLPVIQNAVFEIDPGAFMRISNVREVRGQGFRQNSVSENRKRIEESGSAFRSGADHQKVSVNDNRMMFDA